MKRGPARCTASGNTRRQGKASTSTTAGKAASTTTTTRTIGNLSIPADLRGITAKTVKATRCGQCDASPAEPCEGSGVHLGRYAKAMRDGVITGPDMVAAILAIRGQFTLDSIVPGVSAS
jgi:hypothetical protein